MKSKRKTLSQRVAALERAIMIQEDVIRDNVQNVLAGRMSLDAFRSWLMLSSIDMHLDSSEEAQELARSLRPLVSDYALGYWEDHELMAILGRFAQTRILSYENLIRKADTD